ncbi:unnamed protein product, partial [marine sediment metagenome]
PGKETEMLSVSSPLPLAMMTSYKKVLDFMEKSGMVFYFY